ncbi:hypothetical protein ABOM_001157 [Aspergillus bombycis]|uniref:MYND-type domain-containing protein n=1 Tax=Aspergillus bombycis TaxID=109264 RepID=A0A1F8AEV3_9EURO|nr:hypothetical protein ABOM_001157 [Aspergillus bombycis]OGM50232.1 hypothetical protein ABOM_001157 [Aspergillus bombycis]
MAMQYDRYQSPTVDRVVDDKLPSDTRRELEKHIVLSDASHTTGLGSQTRILRASDVLLSLAGRSKSDTQEPSVAVESLQEVLRLYPPFRDDDGAILGAVDIRCPDCDAVFSSSKELEQHYLTKYCPGTAVAVYLMTRDRLITKGYRMEKRFIPLDSRPVRFYCGMCEKHFAIDDDKPLDRQRCRAYCPYIQNVGLTSFADAPSYVQCRHCGEKCNISYEPVLNDPRDDVSFRDIQGGIASPVDSRSPSIAQMSSRGLKSPATANPHDQSIVKKAKKFRDSWSLRKFSQSDEDELVAISFAGFYDLERAHAPNGLYQPFEGSTAETHPGQSATSVTLSAINDVPAYGSKSSGLAFYENEHHRNDIHGSDGELLDESQNEAIPRRQSFLEKIFGRKVSEGISRARSTSGRRKKLIKKANSIRFSFVNKHSRSESRAATLESARTSVEVEKAAELRQQANQTPLQDAEYIASLRETKNIYIHVQHLSGGIVVHDSSGRQRILQMDEAARLFSQLRDELAATTAWSQPLLTTRLRAEASLRQANCRTAVVEYHDALKILDTAPALDDGKLARATVLHSMGQAYRNLDMAPQSEACYLEALALYKRALGRDSPKNFSVLHDLGALYERDGYATEAAALYERSFAGRLKMLGHNAPETLSSMQDLASLKVLLGDLEAALHLLEKVVPALETVFGLQHATTLNAMNRLSILYQKLGLDKESRAISHRTIPHCRTFFGLNSPFTRDAVVRYFQDSNNFDFPTDIQDILDHYQRSRDPDSLKVIYQLGKSYMDNGLNHDAAELFEALVEKFLTIKGPEASETLDALSALCVSREHQGSIDKAILAYKQLIHMASRIPADHPSRKKIGYAEKQITKLNRRREILADERKTWSLHEPAQCGHCGTTTKVLCNTCKIFRFCSEICQKQALQTHFLYCIPSVSLRESKSLAVRPRCPASARDQAISKIRLVEKTKSVNVTASYTFYLDPRNFTTFRMKLNTDTNTVILFSLDCDIKYATIDNPLLDPNQGDSRSRSTSPSSTSSTADLKGVRWLSPDRREAIVYIPSEMAQPQARYVLVTPGREMLKSIIERRVSVRGGRGDKERFRALELPDDELIEFAQGLFLAGFLGEAFMHVVEWVWK